MPEVRIQYKAGQLGGDEMQQVVDLLDRELPWRLSINPDRRQLTVNDFTINNPERISAPCARISHDVIVRVYIDPEHRNLAELQQHSEELTTLLEEVLAWGTLERPRRAIVCFGVGTIVWPFVS